jgi:hypothetical protein
VTQSSWLAIEYRDFHDVPRLVVIEWHGDLYLLDAPFDEDLDDYTDTYTVYRLPAGARDRVAKDSWADLPRFGEAIGQIAVNDIEFDSTRRNALSDALFRELGLAE